MASRATIKPLPDQRWWNNEQLAHHFSKSVAWLNRNYNILVRAGMPEKDELIGGFDSFAIVNWENRRSGIVDLEHDGKRKIEEQLANGRL